MITGISRVPTLSLRITHLAKNPVRGGIPARFATIARLIHFFLEIPSILPLGTSSIFFTINITNVTEIQYNIENKMKR